VFASSVGIFLIFTEMNEAKGIGYGGVFLGAVILGIGVREIFKAIRK
jgi:hypothetical protein